MFPLSVLERKTIMSFTRWRSYRSTKYRAIRFSKPKTISPPSTLSNRWIAVVIALRRLIAYTWKPAKSTWSLAITEQGTSGYSRIWRGVAVPQCRSGQRSTRKRWTLGCKKYVRMQKSAKELSLHPLHVTIINSTILILSPIHIICILLYMLYIYHKFMYLPVFTSSNVY